MPELQRRPATLVQLLRERAEEMPDELAITFLVDGETQERNATYAELDESSRAIAARLREEVPAGERVLLLYPPSLDYVTAFFGCLYAGVVAVPAYPPILNRPSSQVSTFARDCDATWALTIEPIAALRDQLVEQEQGLAPLRWLPTDTLAPGLAESWEEPDAGADTLAFLQYTSGSTRTPRGVMVSHGNLVTNASCMVERVGLSEETVTVSWLPPYHDAGLIGKVITPLVGAFHSVLMSPLAFLERPARWVEAISRYSGTCSAAPNFGYELAIRKTTQDQREQLDLSAWTRAMNTGEPIRAQTLDDFAEAFGVSGFRRESFYPCYGLAESTVMVTGPDPEADPVVHRLDRDAFQRGEVEDATEGGEVHAVVGCGYDLPDHRMVVVDAETREPVGDRRIGEIWVTGASIAHGYWDKDDETEETFGGRLAGDEADDERVYMRTGDLGYVDDGELFVAGRSKDLILVRGRNFYPQDVERTVEAVDPALRPGCGAAFGVDTEGEERLVVVQEVDERKAQDVDSLPARVREAIGRDHGIEAHAVVLIERGALPKTSSGKQRRRATRDQYLAGGLPVLAE